MNRPHSRLTASVLLLALNVAPLAAQQKPQQPGEMPKLVENIDVRVINVDVVVTDKKGKPVHGLTKDDFQVFENGVEKTISNFYEIVGEKPAQAVAVPATADPAAAKPVPVPKEEINEQTRRRIILYVDNLSMAPFNRNRVFKQMKDFVRDVMRPGDEVMLATFNRSMKVRVPFTRDPVQIQQALDMIAGETALGLSNRSEARDMMDRIRDADTYEDALITARSYAASVEHDLRTSVDSINALMSTLAGVEGKKVLVLTTEGFQIQPGRELFTMIDEVAREKNWQQSSATLEAMSFNGTSYIQSIAKTANANGITLYTIHAGGLMAGSEGMTADNRQPISYAVTSAAVSNTTESLELLAEMTGGLATARTNNFAAAFENIERDLDSYYSLGYRAGTERVDRQRSLDVRVKNRAYRVRSRQTFVEKSTFQEMSDRVIANLLYRTKANDLGVAVKVNTPVAAEDLFRVPVEVRIPIDKLTMLNQGESYVGGFSVFVVVGNKDGDLSDVSRKSHQVTIPVAEFEKAKGKYYTYTLDLMCERGLNKISVGVIDDVSNVSGFDRQQVIAQDLR